ncbi:putative plectin-like [Apostichopus japonicus]|uniref:Putative plectin-like n=1 Tax=Stichopus japonicus TaxID=307972 RepID=A0A2G8KQV4_STIJA|nr:putative plectin-like [Apostichopus japonicus]
MMASFGEPRKFISLPDLYARYGESWYKHLVSDQADRAVLLNADKRDEIQKKTFTKWVNKHLQTSRQPPVVDLFTDLRDGKVLLSLLEALSGERLRRERGKLRIHCLQNVRNALEFLQRKKIRLVNIQCEDIVDGNPKLILGLIWIIILHFQISDVIVDSDSRSHSSSRGQTIHQAQDNLKVWAQRMTAGYPGVNIRDFSRSWRMA